MFSSGEELYTHNTFHAKAAIRDWDTAGRKKKQQIWSNEHNGYMLEQ